MAFPGIAAIEDVPGVIDDTCVTARIDGAAYVDRKAAAMRAHATQVAVQGAFFALSNSLGQPLFTDEYYELARGTSGAPEGERETDLFAGVTAP